MAPLRIGVLGAARITPQALLKPAAGIAEVEVAAVAARDAERARSFASKHGIARVHDSYEALIADPDLDAIYNPLPNGLHARWTTAALEAGKHVLCEKPLANTVAEAEAMTAAAERARADGIRSMVGFTYRRAPAAGLARRLVERGVRFVQVYYGNGQPWDTHSKHNDSVPNLCKAIDQPIATLLTDLKQRGLLEDTLVVWGGEFGRTPTSENGNGRDHNHHGFTMWMAGGGVKGGMTYGETDEFGFKAAVDKVHVHDLHATILHLLGLDHERLTFRHAGRDYRLTDVYGQVVHEIIA